MISGKMYRFRVPETGIDPRFVEAYLQTDQARNAINEMKTGISDSGLNLTHDRFRPLRVPVAPFAEQRRIMDVYEEVVTDLEAGVHALDRAPAKLEEYRAAVLKAAVNGTLPRNGERSIRTSNPLRNCLSGYSSNDGGAGKKISCGNSRKRTK